MYNTGKKVLNVLSALLIISAFHQAFIERQEGHVRYDALGDVYHSSFMYGKTKWLTIEFFDDNIHVDFHPLALLGVVIVLVLSINILIYLFPRRSGSGKKKPDVNQAGHTA